MQRTLVIALLLILITVVFALQNSEPFAVKFFFWEGNYPHAVLIPIAVLFGALLGILFSIPALKKRNEKIELLEDQLKNRKEEE